MAQYTINGVDFEIHAREETSHTFTGCWTCLKCRTGGEAVGAPLEAGPAIMDARLAAGLHANAQHPEMKK